jgi:hypothetical protein
MRKTIAVTTIIGSVSIAALLAGCGSKGSDRGVLGNPDRPNDGQIPFDGGHPVDVPPDGGIPRDGGTPFDGGTPPDGGTVSAFLPDLPGWRFYGPQHGGPRQVYGVTSDPSGNIWVAGGEEGLFLLQPNSDRLRRFTMADGLRPYGYMPDGGDPPGSKYLKVISVVGGPANSVFVGYEGKPPGPGQLECESNWDNPNPDPSIYKSGDADRVTWNGTGISVVHYDIFTGPGQSHEYRGREKLCDILRMAYHPATNSVWFGANHGFAWGDTNFPGDPYCNGDRSCSGLLEHIHPAFAAYNSEERIRPVWLTGGYYGVAVDSIGDVWFGGAHRTTKCRYETLGHRFFECQNEVEAIEPTYRYDIWPDPVTEPYIPTPSERDDDHVSDMAAMPDGTVWISSFNHGLAHYRVGQVIEYRVDTQVTFSGRATALERDPSDNSLWIGYIWGGIARLTQDGRYTPMPIFGRDLSQGRVPDIQSDYYLGQRRILAAFRGDGSGVGAIGIYTGD